MTPRIGFHIWICRTLSLLYAAVLIIYASNHFTYFLINIRRRGACRAQTFLYWKYPWSSNFELPGSIRNIHEVVNIYNICTPYIYTSWCTTYVHHHAVQHIYIIMLYNICTIYVQHHDVHHLYIMMYNIWAAMFSILMYPDNRININLVLKT